MNINFSRRYQWAGVLTNSGITAKKVHRSWWVASRRLNFMMSNDRNELVSSTKYVAMHCNVLSLPNHTRYCRPLSKGWIITHCQSRRSFRKWEQNCLIIFVFCSNIFLFSIRQAVRSKWTTSGAQKTMQWILHGISLNEVSSKLRGWWPLLFLET